MSIATEKGEARFLDDYVGMKVEAADGAAGKVTKQTYDTDKDHFVVRPSVFGKRYQLPGDAIIAVEDGVVRLGITKDEIKNHPPYVNSRRGGGGTSGDHVIPI